MKEMERLEDSIRLLEEDTNISRESPWDQGQASSGTEKRKQELSTHSPNTSTILDVATESPRPSKATIKILNDFTGFFFCAIQKKECLSSSPLHHSRLKTSALESEQLSVSFETFLRGG